MKKRFIFQFFLLPLLLLFSCQVRNVSVDTNTATNLYEKKWILQEKKTNAEEQLLTLEFKEETQTVRGYSGCNSFFGELSIKGQQLSILQIGSTKMLCVENRMKREQRYLSALEKVDNFSLSGNTLLLKKKDRVLLTFIVE